MNKILLIKLWAMVISFGFHEEHQVEKEVSMCSQYEQKSTVGNGYAKMSFEERTFDFGTIKQGTMVEHVFHFTNTGSEPLVIADVKSSCGCTVPERPKEPIMPGEAGEIVVKFNGRGMNQVTKTVTINANTETGTELIYIKAFIERL